MKESRILIYTLEIFPQEKEEVEKIWEKEMINMDPLGNNLDFSEGESALAAHYLKYSLEHPKVTDPPDAPARE